MTPFPIRTEKNRLQGSDPQTGSEIQGYSWMSGGQEKAHGEHDRPQKGPQ